MYNNEQIWKIFGRILAETCLKIDYFGNKSPSAGGSALRPLVQVEWLENVQKPTPIKITGWCRCLTNLGQNQTYTVPTQLPSLVFSIITSRKKSSLIVRFVWSNKC